MSGKRPAANELTHENWDRDEEPEERGTFRVATENEIKNRIIKKATRKVIRDTDATTDDNTKKTIFGGFTGFAKQTFTAESNTSTVKPFSFLSKLSATTTTATLISTSNANAFSFAVSSVPNISPFSSSLKNVTDINAVSNTNFTDGSTKTTTTSCSLISASKNTAETTTTSSLSNTFSFGGTRTVPKNIFSYNPTAQVAGTSLISTLSPTCTNTKTTSISSLSTSNSSKSAFALGKTNPLPPTPTSAAFNERANVPKEPNMENTENVSKTDGNSYKSGLNKDEYSIKLRELNVAVSAWIKMHVDKNPLCILTPIFKDYERHLRQIEKEKTEGLTILSPSEGSISAEINSCSENTPVPQTNGFQGVPDTSLKSDNTNNKPSNAAFTFASKMLNTSNDTGVSESKQICDVPTTNTPVSCGNTKPNNNNDTAKEDDDDEPIKVEFKKVVENGAIYSKTCKVFFKKDSEFIEKGVGTLYIKPVQNNEKTQLLVRADTNLGKVLVNLILAKSLPVKRVGKNNVLMICVPLPDVAKPAPLLLRVKTPEDADELLQKIEQYKK